MHRVAADVHPDEWMPTPYTLRELAPLFIVIRQRYPDGSATYTVHMSIGAGRPGWVRNLRDDRVAAVVLKGVGKH
jgi:hypothetical protein